MALILNVVLPSVGLLFAAYAVYDHARKANMAAALWTVIAMLWMFNAIMRATL